MKPITLRNLPPEIARRIARKAREKGLSLNRAVIAALEEAFGVRRGKAPAAYDDLEFLVGTLSREEADALNRTIRSQRRVDPEVWS